MRTVLWLSFPIGLLCLAILVTILANWARGVPVCGTWLAAAIPLCSG
jgi:hypothetical protein